MLFFARLKIVVLEKSRPTYHYRFSVTRKNAIYRHIKNCGPGET